MKLDYCVTPYININSKWIKDSNVRLETIKLLAKNMGGKLPDIGLDDDFLNLTPKVKATKEKISGIQQAKMFLHRK